MSAPLWHETIALFGGRFDPPHRGHFEAIQGLFKNPGAREVWVLPSLSPPHKPAAATFPHRAEMARLGLVRGPNIRLDLREAERAGASYTFDTLTGIKRETDRIAFVIGTDQLEALPTWHRFPDVLKLAHWIVLERNGLPSAEALLRALQGTGFITQTGTERLFKVSGSDRYLTVVPTEARALSSTAIRETLEKTGNPPTEALFPEVEAYLKSHGLYGTKGDLR